VQPKTLSVKKRCGIIKISSPDVYRQQARHKKAPPKRGYVSGQINFPYHHPQISQLCTKDPFV
jgi:hypothetical protein